MSYNLLLDTGFKKINKHWKLTNCEYKNGYLISDNKIYSIEQEIALPKSTKLYFSLNYICFDNSVKSIYCGILTGADLEVCKKKPKLYRRKKISVVTDSELFEKIKVKFIVEATSDHSKIYIDSPLLIDLVYLDKSWYPKYFLDTILDYRYGYDYDNLYSNKSEICIDSPDFTSASIFTEKANIGILAQILGDEWFRITYDFIPEHYYLVKLDYKELNTFGTISLNYGLITSSIASNNLLWIIFKADDKKTSLLISLLNSEKLLYLVNLKRLLLIDITNLSIDLNDIEHLPFI